MRFSLITLFSLFILSQPLYAESQVTAVIHVHSDASKGKQTLAQIAKHAERNQIDAVLMTDLLQERYEYGIWPLRGIIKKVVERPSIRSFGLKEYFAKLQSVDRESAKVTMMAGVAATPYYYWTGSLSSKEIILHDRAKDLLAFGLRSTEDYDSLPVIGTKHSRFNPYEGKHSVEAYQDFIDDVKKKGGVVFWSHPQSEEHESYKTPFLDVNVRLETSNQVEQLKRTTGYTGFGIDPVSLQFVHEQPSLITADGFWDKLLLQYCRGLRSHPVWVIGESDYMGDIQADQKLNVILNGLYVEQGGSKEMIEALRTGKIYVLMPDSTLTRRLRLDEFSAADTVSGVKVRMGELLQVQGLPRFRVSMSYPDLMSRSITLQLIRNGELYQEWQETVPFQTAFEDLVPLPEGQRSYYRLIAFTEEGDRILTNPIFAEPTP